MWHKFLNKKSFIICALLAIASCDQQPSSQTTTAITENKTPSRQTLIRGGEFSHFQLNPQQVTDLQNSAIIYDLYEGLVSYDLHGNIIPAIAQSWQTKDNKVWLFSLRNDAKWSDGSSVTATDFVKSWQNLFIENSPSAQYLAFIATKNAKAILQKQAEPATLGVTALDEHHLQIELDKANANFPLMLAHISLLPIKNSLHNGAYTLNNIDENKVILTRNPFYWQKLHVSFQKVEYWRTNLKSKEIDLHLNVNNDTQQTVPKLCSYYYELNPHHHTLKNSAVRQALVSLISSKSAINGVNINGKASTNLLPSSMLLSAYFNSAPPEQLLQQAGITIQHPLQLSLIVDNNSTNIAIAQNLVRQFSQSDLIRASIQAKTQQEWSLLHSQQQFQLIRSGWCADYNDISAFLNNFHSKSPDNLMHYRNEKVDQWLEQAMLETSNEKRQQIYQQVLDTLTTDAIILPIYHYYLPIKISADLAGYDLNNPTQIFYSKDLYRSVQ
ncbi:peptide ABC transporter substrate-binding protein [Gallibacterium genomosp. 1]|uniref:Solute-binding protein family 5 domain-containing protein n=1 Tax=Gallibacterium genomosp. 1 TaxID=155515 RepID=A0AB36DZ02_9PAST|nr:peptide ABC transporter substrate-binding protein [Gallibacterium genomosp. 1]OBX02877.1 hypothetical protein QV05_01030 [Gallibacterium genomosp. 1]OBX03736.1 hypothetical protein QV04_00285 [Gallibacterium genomosp. 1]